MPYPGDGNRDRDLADWETFRWNKWASDPATRSDPAATSQTLWLVRLLRATPDGRSVNTVSPLSSWPVVTL